MKIIITGDKDFDGVFIAIFKKDDSEYKLYFNLDNWKNINTNGIFNGEYYQTFTPSPITIMFNKEYECSIEDARSIYTIMISNGWKPIIKE